MQVFLQLTGFESLPLNDPFHKTKSNVRAGCLITVPANVEFSRRGISNILVYQHKKTDNQIFGEEIKTTLIRFSKQYHRNYADVLSTFGILIVCDRSFSRQTFNS